MRVTCPKFAHLVDGYVSLWTAVVLEEAAPLYCDGKMLNQVGTRLSPTASLPCPGDALITMDVSARPQRVDPTSEHPSELG